MSVQRELVRTLHGTLSASGESVYSTACVSVTVFPTAIRCDTCQELLVDLIYFHSPEKNVIYCGRHHGDSLVRRCTGCDEVRMRIADIPVVANTHKGMY